MNPDMFPQCKNRRSIIGKRPDLDNRFFRSAWEANYARYLNWMMARREINSWGYEVETFEFAKIKRGSRFYTPDFKVFFPDGRFEFHEIKGYMDSKSATKLKRMKKYFPHIPVVLIDKTIYRQIAVQFGPMLNGWEGRYELRTRRILK